MATPQGQAMCGLPVFAFISPWSGDCLIDLQHCQLSHRPWPAAPRQNCAKTLCDGAWSWSRRCGPVPWSSCVARGSSIAISRCWWTLPWRSRPASSRPAVSQTRRRLRQRMGHREGIARSLHPAAKVPAHGATCQRARSQSSRQALSACQRACRSLLNMVCGDTSGRSADQT